MRAAVPWIALLLLVLSPYTTRAKPAQLTMPVLWRSELRTFTESGPTVADIDGDARAEVVVAAREEIVALGRTGQEIWRWKSSGRLMTYPAILRRPGKLSLIYVADYTGKLTCLDGAGRKIWQAQLKGPISWSAAVVCDLEADGVPEVVQTDGAGTVWAFRALTGKEVWHASVQGVPVSPAVGDLSGDGKPEVVVVTGAGRAVALDGAGKRLWKFEIGGTSPSWATAAPVLFADSSGAGRVIAASNDGRVYCLDSDGSLVWSRPTHGPVASTISAGDYDADGRADIFLITQLGTVYRFDEEGNLLWQIEMHGRSLAAGAVIDVNNDGHLEYVVSTQDGHLLVLNQAGETVFQRQFDFRTINVTPAFGDVQPDRPGLEMVLTGGESGRVLCLGTNAPAKTAAAWTAYRGDEKKSGAWLQLRREASVRMIPENLARSQAYAGEPIRFVISNPKGEPLQATAVCIRPDGARLVATSRILGGHGRLDMPIDFVVAGRYDFTWSLAGPAGHPLFSDRRHITLEPFVNDRALVQAVISKLRSAASTVRPILPASSAALGREAESLRRRLDVIGPLQTMGLGGQGKLDEAARKTGHLVASARRASRIAEIVVAASRVGPGTSLIAFPGTTWENRAVDRELPQSITASMAIKRALVRGEHDSVVVHLFNVTDRPLQSRVRIEDHDSGITVTPHRSVPVISSLGEPSWDALPELDESAVITIPSLSSGEVWLAIDTGSAAAGDHQVTLHIQALNGAGVLAGPGNPHSVPPPETAVTIALRILPFQMASSGRLRLCTWPRVDGPATRRDLLDHGGNVFLGPQATVRYTDDGQIAGFDYSKLDAVTAPLAGQDIFYLIQGMPALRADMGSPEYAKRLAVCLHDLVRHLASQGIEIDHFALYPIDEPGGGGWGPVNRLVQFGKLVRQAAPHVMIYVDGGGEKPMFEALAPYTDIWCPGLSMLAETTPEMNVIRNSGKTIWSYDCSYKYARPAGANLKNINIVGQYRTAALFALHYGGSGIGYWCYNSGEDMWGRTQLEFPLVYAGRTRPVTSRRWEAVREGIEDYRIAFALRERLQSKDLAADARARIEHLIGTTLAQMVARGYQEMTLGLDRQTIDSDNNDATIRTFRKEMIACIDALTASPSLAATNAAGPSGAGKVQNP